MIFVILGTEKFPFDRLVRKVDSLVENKEIEEKVFIQIGSCRYKPAYCEWKRFLSFGEICEKITESRLVVSHAGAGTTLLCIQYKKKLILVPRIKQFNEHVDNHQLIFAKKMEELELAKAAFDINDLAGLIRNHRNGEWLGISERAVHKELIKYLNNLLNSCKLTSHDGCKIRSSV